MSKKESPATSDIAPGRTRKSHYSDDFKRDAVRLVSEEKYSFKAAAAAVNVSSRSLRNWYALLVPESAPCGEDATVTELREENQRLRQQLRRAELEREILKKATAYFAKESL